MCFCLFYFFIIIIFFSREVALLFVIPSVDTDQGSTEPYLACAVTLAGVAVGLLALVKVATTDSGVQECPTCRGRLWHLPGLPHSPKIILFIITVTVIEIIISLIPIIVITIIIILVIVIAIITVIILLFVVVVVLTGAIKTSCQC